MAAAGFPWAAESHVREPTYLDEKVSPPAVPAAKPSETHGNIKTTASPPLQNGTKRCSIADQPQGKRRANSLKPQKANRTIARQYEPQRQRAGLVQLPVRTLPAWIQDANESDLEDVDASYLDAPDVAFLAQHNHSPSVPRRSIYPLSPHEHRAHPTSSGNYRPEPTSRWVSFGRASVYPRENFDNEKVAPEYLNEHFTDYSRPWLADQEDDEDGEGVSRYRAFRKKRQAWYTRAQFTILRNPFIPLAFRLTVIIFAITAIGLGVTIFRETGRIQHCLQQNPNTRTTECREKVGDGPVTYYRDPSALMAIIVDVVSVMYSGYITYDEYFSKPLGLRPARAKIRLVLLDLFFIVFQAANLSLSFESLTVDEGACQVGDTETTEVRFARVCSRQESLSGVLLVSLVAWLLTFSVSVLRYVACHNNNPLSQAETNFTRLVERIM